MSLKRIAIAAAFTALTSVAAFAQATQPAIPATPARPAAPAAAPVAPAVATPAATTAAKPATATPVTKKVNLNTADAKELDSLPQIGEARVKAILEARTKAKFKDWADFEKRNVVPKNAEDAIKDKVTF